MTTEAFEAVELFVPLLTRELKLRPDQVRNALKLLTEDNTIPFIARYRKEVTGNLDELQIGTLHDRFHYLSELEARRAQILASVKEQEKLTPELEKVLRAADSKQRLEDLYLPYKPKRRTRATLAKEQGLEPLALLLQTPDTTAEQAESWLAEFNASQETAMPAEQVWQGARDLLAEAISEVFPLISTRTSFLISSLCELAFECPPKIGAITKPIKQVSLIKIFIEGPDVSLKGSPTVSPVIAAS